MTQRVIRVPVKPLIAGDAKYNIVIRPGDIIRVPSATQGIVYVVGQVARPGTYNFPEVGKMTLLRAVDSAGGFGSLAIPERVDLTRVVGKNMQATIRVDMRAINEGTMPDIYIKPGDRINVGTNFWAFPLAVFRNGLRMSYGFRVRAGPELLERGLWCPEDEHPRELIGLDPAARHYPNKDRSIAWRCNQSPRACHELSGFFVGV